MQQKTTMRKMPDRTESGGDAAVGSAVMKKRQPVAKGSSFNQSGGYSTDESTVSNNRDKKRRGGKKPDSSSSEGGMTGKASVIWMVLVIGLMFCLMDAAYIARVLERGPTIEDGDNSYAADLVIQQLRHRRAAQNMEQYIPQTKSERQQHVSNHHLDFSAALGHAFGRDRKVMTAEEKAARRAQQEKEKKEAEAKRIKNIKMAALEALKAEHGGKIPDELIDKTLADEEAFKARPMSYYKDAALKDDKTRILDLFTDAGLKEMDDSTYAALPKWNDVKKMYGDEPRIIGLEQCKTFQAKGNPWDHFVSTAGTFNSGTNLMAEMLIHNCHMQARMDKLGHQNRGIRWQVPWGKHTPPGDEEYRLEHKSMKDKDVDATMILPAVTVRDPYYWMQSMCKHHYTASWRASDRCPNLTPLESDKARYPMLKDKDFFPLSVRYADFHRQHQSLTGLWNDWYNEYKGVEFQRLFVRYEDLLFHPKNVTQTVCHCAGGQMNKGKFMYQVDSAKKGLGAHGSIRTGYVDAIIKYGSDRHRYRGYHPEDLEYARKHLDTDMMESFGYKYHPASLEHPDAEKQKGEDGGNEHEDEPEEVGDAQKEHKEEHEEPDVPEEEEAEDKDSDGEPDVERSADIGDKNDLEENAADVVDQDEIEAVKQR